MVSSKSKTLCNHCLPCSLVCIHCVNCAVLLTSYEHMLRVLDTLQNLLYVARLEIYVMLIVKYMLLLYVRLLLVKDLTALLLTYLVYV